MFLEKTRRVMTVRKKNNNSKVEKIEKKKKQI